MRYRPGLMKQFTRVSVAERALELSMRVGGSVAVTLIANACVPKGKPTELTPDIARTYHFECPPEKIRVLQERRIGVDRIWSLDACGVPIELEKGLDFPKRQQDLTTLSDDQMRELQESLLTPGVTPQAFPDAVMVAARAKAKEWCVLAAEDHGPADAIRISNPTAAEVAECQQRVENRTLALGTERDAHDGHTRYWIRVLDWAFPVSIDTHPPSCSRLTLTTTPEYCECERARGAVASCDSKQEARNEQLASLRVGASGGKGRESSGAESASSEAQTTASQPPPSAQSTFQGGLYTHGVLGFGSLASTLSGAQHLGGWFIEGDGALGAWLSPSVVLGAEASAMYGLGAEHVTVVTLTPSGSGALDADVTTRLLGLQLFARAFIGDSGLFVDALAGGAALRRIDANDARGESNSIGWLFGSSLGWSNAGDSVDLELRLHPFYAITSDDGASVKTYGASLGLSIAGHARRSGD
jgi:hypothetical protein